MQTILILDDDPAVAACLAYKLNTRYKVKIVRRYSEAVNILSSGDQIDLVISDYNLTENFTGQDLVKHIKKVRPDLPVIICTGEQHVNSVPGASAFLRKPVSIEDLLEAVEKFLAK